MLNQGAITNTEQLLDAVDEVKDDKFLQTKIKRLDNSFIDYVISAPKHPVGAIDINDNIIDLDFEFGSTNEMSTASLDYCKNGFKFCAMKDNKGRLHLCGIYTINTPRGMSCSLYYLPNASFENICFIGRVCYHMGTNPHINKLGDKKIINNYVLHLHKQSEEYFDYCMQHYKDDPQLIKKLQGPDAEIVYGVECKNIKQLTDFALKTFGVTNEPINVKVDCDKKVIQEIVKEIEQIERGL